MLACARALSLTVSVLLPSEVTGNGELAGPDHVVLVILENHGYSSIIGSPDAPFINALAEQGASLTRSFAVIRSSQPNYLAVFFGSLQNIDGNACLNHYTTPNLASALFQSGLSFPGYSEDLPEPGAIICRTGHSTRKHSPWVNWQRTEPNGIPPQANLPWTSFPTDYSALPTVSIVIPNNAQCGRRARPSNRWLQQHLAGYVEWTKSHNSLFILTWDEDNGREVNRIAPLFVVPMVRSGRVPRPFTHFNVLRTIEDLYGLRHSGRVAPSDPLLDIWVSSLSRPRG